MTCEFAADGAGAARNAVDNPGWHASPLCQLAQGQGRQRRLAGGLDDHGATRRQRRPDFAGNHRSREIPRRNGCAHTDGLFQHYDAFIARMRRNGVAINPLGFFTKPFDETRGIGDFAARFA